MANERITENLVRDQFRALDYYSTENDVRVEEQKSEIEDVKKLLKAASKTGIGKGSPEFIVSDLASPDLLLIVECKASVTQHESAGRDKPGGYAVDGALHYARALSRSFNVIALGASGQTVSQLKVSAFLWPRASPEPKLLTNEHGVPIESILPFSDFVRHASFDPQVAQNRHHDLMEFSRDLHDFMRDHAKLTESEKPLLVSGTLIALRSKAFAKTFGDYSPENLQKQWLHVIKEEIQSADIPNSKKATMSQPYSSIAVHPELGKATNKYPKGVLHELIKMLNDRVWPFVSIYHDFDVVGEFYGEFLKYTGGDKKALGIVLTPRHVTELFSLLPNLTIQTDHQGTICATKVLDICAGTGGFLISAMQRLLKSAHTDAERQHIRRNCLIGVEQLPNMYTLAASNMILRGDGKANLYQGSCFDEAVTEAVRTHRCTVGMLNPPYSQGDEGLHELVFVKHMLDCLETGGTGITIVPISCAIAPHTLRGELLKYHTLEAVMSMPEELFYPVGVITCIMVFTAHVPHKSSDKKTWFGYWRDDGFIKTKHRGRIDLHKRWPETRERWVAMFRNREIHAGQSVARYVTHKDEWCAEAYMESDYSDLAGDEFAIAARNYAVSRLLSETELGTNEVISTENWRWFALGDLFDLRKGKRLTKAEQVPGATPFIGAIDKNNGLARRIGQSAIHEGGTITVNYNGNGVAEAFYQPSPFWASDDVNVLYPKFELSPYRAMFIVVLIRREKYRFSYGRKWHLERMKDHKIKLPCTLAGEPDWHVMENYIKALPFSSHIV